MPEVSDLSHYMVSQSEIGPFVFSKKRPRDHVTFLQGGSAVSFKEGTEYYFVEEESVAPITSEVCTLNVPLVGALEIIRAKSPSRFSPWIQMVLRILERWADPNIHGIFMKRQIDQLLFGYEDPLLSKISTIIPGIEGRISFMPNVTAVDGDDIVMLTGSNGKYKELGDLVQWKGVSTVMSWSHPEKVRGTNGMQFPPRLFDDDTENKSDKVRVWVGDLFRSIELMRNGSGTIDGVEFTRFMPEPSVFDASTEYFQKYKGLMNITRPVAVGIDGRGASAGPPLFLSLPGYCNVDEMVSNGVKGVNCEPDRHTIYLDVGELF